MSRGDDLLELDPPSSSRPVLASAAALSSPWTIFCGCSLSSHSPRWRNDDVDCTSAGCLIATASSGLTAIERWMLGRIVRYLERKIKQRALLNGPESTKQNPQSTGLQEITWHVTIFKSTASAAHSLLIGRYQRSLTVWTDNIMLMIYARQRDWLTDPQCNDFN